MREGVWVGYATVAPPFVRLYESGDGIAFKALVPALFEKGETERGGAVCSMGMGVACVCCDEMPRGRMDRRSWDRAGAVYGVELEGSGNARGRAGADSIAGWAIHRGAVL